MTLRLFKISGATRFATTLGLIALGGFALVGCAKSASNVVKQTPALTQCPAASLAVYNYKKASGTWNAACGEQIFNCSEVSRKQQCSPVPAQDVSAEQKQRVQLLQQIPKSRRDFFATTDIMASPWDDFARSAAVVARLNDAQLGQVDDPRTVYTGFSAAFDRQLTQCVGGQKVATVSVSPAGVISASRGQATCVQGLTLSAELAPLKKYAGATIVLAPGVRDLTVASQPGAQPAVDPAAAAEAKRLEEEAQARAAAEAAAAARLAAVHAWLDGTQAALTTCTGLKEIPLDVLVDEQGVPTVTLQGKLNTKNKASCAKAALGEKQFDAGEALQFSYVVGAPKPEPAAEEASPATTDGATGSATPAAPPPPPPPPGPAN